MTARQGIVAQMSTYPLDVRHVEYLLPHQLRVWAPMVDRIVVTIDTHQSTSGRYRGSNFNESLDKLRRVVEQARSTCPQLEVADVDYSDAMRREVSQYFFNVDSIPIKAWDGGPFYSYFFGLYVANARYVMHFDGDMMFGGGSRSWMRDAIAFMEQRPDVLVTAPFPGPPSADGEIYGHQAQAGVAHVREALPYPAYRHVHVSTRAFMIDLERFKSALGAFPHLRPSLKQRLKSKLLGNPPDAREAEVVMSQTLQNANLCRVDLAGNGPGLWSLHPPYRSEEFYRRLPELIRCVETGRVPAGQHGHYDLNDSMIDWTQARAANHWHKRYLRMIRQRLSSLGAG